MLTKAVTINKAITIKTIKLYW